MHTSGFSPNVSWRFPELYSNWYILSFPNRPPRDTQRQSRNLFRTFKLQFVSLIREGHARGASVCVWGREREFPRR